MTQASMGEAQAHQGVIEGWAGTVEGDGDVLAGATSSSCSMWARRALKRTSDVITPRQALSGRWRVCGFELLASGPVPGVGSSTNSIATKLPPLPLIISAHGADFVRFSEDPA